MYPKETRGKTEKNVENSIKLSNVAIPPKELPVKGDLDDFIFKDITPKYVSEK